MKNETKNTFYSFKLKKHTVLKQPMDYIKDGQRDAASFHCNELIVKRPTVGTDMLLKQHQFGARAYVEGTVSAARVYAVLSTKFRAVSIVGLNEEIVLPQPFFIPFNMQKPNK